MEALYIILGLGVLYTWIHGVVIVVKKIKDLTEYEGVILWVALAGFVLTLIGIISE